MWLTWECSLSSPVPERSLCSSELTPCWVLTGSLLALPDLSGVRGAQEFPRGWGQLCHPALSRALAGSCHPPVTHLGMSWTAGLGLVLLGLCREPPWSTDTAGQPSRAPQPGSFLSIHQLRFRIELCNSPAKVGVGAFPGGSGFCDPAPDKLAPFSSPVQESLPQLSESTFSRGFVAPGFAWRP